MTEETPEAFSPRSPVERAQVSVTLSHRRFVHAALWAMLQLLKVFQLQVAAHFGRLLRVSSCCGLSVQKDNG